ncbi:MAG: MFS transporter, partial [Sinobacteraceae bacterium]|nr:MFS transporter [Nevskiaceae bacterium]
MEYGELDTSAACRADSDLRRVAARARTTLLLCTAAALFEGFDNQSMGVAAPKLVPEFGLSPAQASILFSATTFGLFLGAAAGGRIADRWGRKPTLAASLFVFGLCSLLTAVATGPDFLLAARLLTGLGLGAAMPNFIALSSEAAAASQRLSAVTLVMAGMPFGGALSAVLALSDSMGWSWRSIFYVGGAVPIVLSLLILRYLPDGGAKNANKDERNDDHLESVSRVLFGEGRAWTTLALWGGFFFTQLVLFLMLNWLPSLLIGLGYTHSQASVASICFGVSGAAGAALLGRLHGGARRRLWVAVTYIGMLISLVILPMAGISFALTALASGLAGV